jgi:ribosomal protein L16/L10AE
MKQFPNNIIYKKSHKKKRFVGLKGTKLALYTTGIKIKGNSYLSYSQYEATRKVIVKVIRPKEVKNKKNLKLLHSAKKRKKPKRHSKKKYLLLRTNFYSPLTKKPLQVRMGKGKGNPYTWVYPAMRSRVIIEMSRQHHNIHNINRIFSRAHVKLPKQTKFIFDRKFSRRELNFKSKI